MTCGRGARHVALALLPASALAVQGAVLPAEQAAVALGAALSGLLLLLPGPRVGARALWGLGALALAGLLSGAATPVPDATARTAGQAWAVVIAGFAVVVLAVAPPRASWERGLAWATATFAGLGLAHAASGNRLLFGLVEARPGIGAYFGPLVNPNHAGLLLVAGLPFVVSAWPRSGPVGRAVLGATALWTLLFPLAARSVGLAVVLGAVVLPGLLVALVPPGRRRGVGVVLGGLALLGALVGAPLLARVAALQPEWWVLSAEPRLRQWADAWPMLRDHPFVGVGLGAYEAAYVRYRTVLDFARFEHAHADGIEWVVETGTVGVLAGLLALGLALPRWRAVSWPWRLSLLALLAHAMIDFPLHIPGVALVFVLLGALALRDEALGDGGLRQRLVLAGLVVGTGLGAALVLWGRSEVVDLAERALAGEASPAQLERLAHLAPDRAEVQVARLEAAPTVEAAEAVLTAPWPSGLLLARTAATLVKLDAPERAEVVLLRSLREQPNDYRTWRLLALLRSRRGDGPAAADAWVEALRRWPRKALDGDDPFEEAFATLPLGSYWLAALADAPAHWSIRLSRVLLRRERYALALAACEQAGRLRPAAHAWSPECAEARVGLGDRAGALAYVRRWTAERPDDVWGWVARARTAADGPVVGAEEVEAVRRAVALRPAHGAVKRLLSDARRRAQACTVEGTCPDAGILLGELPGAAP